MKISSYTSLFDDWELLEASLKSIDPLVEEIVVVDGAYNWMRPSFGSSRRDVTRSLDPVYDVLSTFGSKVRVITGVWENELEKRMAGFEACSNRHVFRHDADEVLYLDQPALERFFRSGLGVAEMTMPIYAAPGWIIATNRARIERQSCLFDRSVISARDHLSYLWLVISSEERQSLAGRDRGQVFQEAIAFNAHLTHWRPPATAVNRARFYVLNYIRSSGKLGWYPSFTYSAESGFSDLFSEIDPETFTDICYGNPIVAGPPAMENRVLHSSPLSPDQESILVPLREGFFRGLASLNGTLSARPRAIARGTEYFLDVSTPESVDNLAQGGSVHLQFSDQVAACKVSMISLGTSEPHLTCGDLDFAISGREVSFAVAALPDGSDRPLQRAICISAWGEAKSPTMTFKSIR
ncbi:MAG TPA: hypothetical protein VN754_15245 [Candidatus Binataceae bacterium]|nr:hypothetical protein [Candidatus Binataceae bacterium]